MSKNATKSGTPAASKTQTPATPTSGAAPVVAVVTVDQLPEWRSRGSKYADLIESVDKAVPGLKFPRAATFTIPNGNANGIYSAISDHVMSKYNKPTRRFWVRKTETGAAVVPVQPESK